MRTASASATDQAFSQKAMLWIVFAGFFMQTLDTTIVNTALPAMARSLGEKPLDLKPVVVAYTLTMAMLTPASGWLADRFGTRRVYFSAILIFVIGSVFCATAHTLTQLVIARVLQGIGGSMLLPIGRLAVLRNIPGEQYIAALAFVSIAGQVGPIFGPVLGGWLVQSASWHWIFLINVPVGLVGLFAVHRYLPAGEVDAAPPFDWIGCGLLSLCMVTFSLALERGSVSSLSAALMAASIASALLYIPHARRHRTPLFRLALFREPNFTVGLVGNLVCRIGSGAVPFLLPLLFQLQLGYSPFHSGLMLLPVAISGTISKRWIVPLVNRFGYDIFLLVNTVIVGASIASFAAISPGWPLGLSIVQLAIFGAANSMQFAAMNGVTLKGLSREDAGSGNSLFSMVQMLAIGLGVTIGGGLVSLFSAKLGVAAPAYRLAFLSVGMITLASAMVFRRLDADLLNPKRTAVEAR
ncbi:MULTISPECIES: multidrug transporter subunit MdtD [Cupriavidus]|jgi:MFS transporter, DHA2 family, multidrug resistance protein|uniref:DHA2 family efflux MFS transporter permease subunit n=1 Tax=Cupriavidus metallidurans TaxID=119219 RepID=A0A2L0X3V9_9BURK|nr:MULTISPECIES: multidrug transporter subunit MdtD [Cupriavidus]AVA34801.1 MFS transporter [Cupriavidus metallidurans]KWR85080.1 EmrB/QacA subfamily drug resistance transporter [Cupriavidus sp. SHE]QBP12155.1 DHA2 family efflux MFS transporter permease subunit [Cupriavidus metallidurans]QWC92123.1 multidrug transporter subunit MdtD [Cupriavidus metallidurans]